MAMPDQIERVRVTVTTPDASFESGVLVLHDVEYSVGDPGQFDAASIPATLAVIAGTQASRPVTIEVAGKKGDKWRTFRQVTTTVPTTRTVNLRMPIQWLCDGTAVESKPADSSPEKVHLDSSCGPGKSCKAGDCVPAEVESETLEDYAPEAVYGGGAEATEGKCFDTLPCMVTGSPVEPDSECTIAAGEASNLNVGLRVANDGICDSQKEWCFVPLNGGSDEGWKPATTAGRVHLPTEVCKKLNTGLVSGIYVSHSCATKTAGDPPCGGWSSVEQKAPPPADVPDAEPPANGTLLTTLAADGLRPCCPLQSEGDKLYTCLCKGTAPQGAQPSSANLVEVDATSGRSRTVSTLAPPANRKDLFFFTAFYQGELYWPDNDQVHRTPISGGPDPAPLVFDGAIYHQATLVADATAVFGLATAVSGTNTKHTQIMKLARSGPPAPFDTGSEEPTVPFGADDAAIYLASVTQEGGDGGQIRKSRVVRLAKSDGRSTDMLPAESETVSGTVTNGGYAAVVTDDTSLFALYNAIQSSGDVVAEVYKVPLDAPAASRPDRYYHAPLNPSASALKLLGAADGAVLLSRLEKDLTGEPRSSYVLFVSKTEHYEIVGTYDEDVLDGLAMDAKNVYWMTETGKIYLLPRSALQ
jgi:hypothetical protein